MSKRTDYDSTLDRRAFLRNSALAGAATLLPAAALSKGLRNKRDDSGDPAILRWFAAAEILETDAWVQYAELAEGNPAFRAALSNIDGDMVAYGVENTVDEHSHAAFLNAFLASEGVPTVNLDQFRTLPSSHATGANQVKRLTNLMHLNVDTSFYTRYRSAGNPDFGDTFPQIVSIVNRPGIPLHDGYTDNQIQAIANTAAFHWAMIEQGGTSLYATMGGKASSAITLEILESIGGSEVVHFAIWNDKAGDCPAVDSGDGLVFPDFSANTTFRSNQVMPRPCTFISKNLPKCAVIRPVTFPRVSATGAVKFFTDTGLFHGQSQAFFNFINDLAEDADEAMRHE